MSLQAPGIESHFLCFSLLGEIGNLAAMNTHSTPNLRSRFSKNPSGEVAQRHVDAAACVSGVACRLF